MSEIFTPNCFESTYLTYSKSNPDLNVSFITCLLSFLLMIVSLIN